MTYETTGEFTVQIKCIRCNAEALATGEGRVVCDECGSVLARTATKRAPDVETYAGP